MDGAVLQAASRALPSELAADTDTGTLGIYRLKRYWSRVILARQGHPVRVSKREHHLDHLVLHATGIGLEQAASFLGNAPTFEDFEHWIVATTGGVDPARVARINTAVTAGEYPEDIKRLLAALEASEPVLSEQDIAFWHEHGYVVLHDAVA